MDDDWTWSNPKLEAPARALYASKPMYDSGVAIKWDNLPNRFKDEIYCELELAAKRAPTACEHGDTELPHPLNSGLGLSSDGALCPGPNCPSCIRLGLVPSAMSDGELQMYMDDAQYNIDAPDSKVIVALVEELRRLRSPLSDDAIETAFHLYWTNPPKGDGAWAAWDGNDDPALYRKTGYAAFRRALTLLAVRFRRSPRKGQSMNQVTITRTVFENVATGQKSFGFRAYDDHGSEYNSDMSAEDMELGPVAFFRKVLGEGFAGEALTEMLDLVELHRITVEIDGEAFEADALFVNAKGSG